MIKEAAVDWRGKRQPTVASLVMTVDEYKKK